MSDANIQASLRRPAATLPLASQASAEPEKLLTFEHVDLTSLSVNDFSTTDKDDSPIQNQAKLLAASVINSNPQSTSSTSSTSISSISSSNPDATRPSGNIMLLHENRSRDDQKVLRESKSHRKPLPTAESMKHVQKQTGVTSQQQSRSTAVTGVSMPAASTLPKAQPDSLSQPHENPSSSGSSQPARSRGVTESFQAYSQAFLSSDSIEQDNARFQSLYQTEKHSGSTASGRNTDVAFEIHSGPTWENKGSDSATDAVKRLPKPRTDAQAGLSSRCKWGSGVVASLATGVVSLLFIDGPYAADREEANFSNLLPGLALGAATLLLIGTSFTLGKTHTH